MGDFPDPFMPGVFHTMDANAYHAVEAMSASGAKKMLQSPAHYRLMRTVRSEPSAAMQFGTAVHSGVLEPHTFAETVAEAPDVDKRTKAGKEEWAAFSAAHTGAIMLSRYDYRRATRCIDAVRSHPAAAKLLDGGDREVSICLHDARYKVPCKARWDIRNHGGAVDLKTCQDASPEGFARQIANLLYHVQGAHYWSGAEHALNESPAFFAFIAVESEEPHAVACYVLPSNAILAGGHLMNIALERYADALANGAWRGYSDRIESITLPKWATTFNH